MSSDKTVHGFIEKNQFWKPELKLLREIILCQNLKETIKWGFPVYTSNGQNVVGMGAFRSYVGLWFFQGALLIDKEQRLVNAQEGKTKAMRQWRFNTIGEIKKSLVSIEEYLQESIEHQKQGKIIKPQLNKPVIIPSELKDRLVASELLNVFNELSLSKRRNFAEYISLAKRAETKAKRLDKIIPMIQAGVGMNDKYSKN